MTFTGSVAPRRRRCQTDRMRRSRTLALAPGAITVLVVLVAGCGSQGTDTSGDRAGTVTGTTSSQPPAPSASTSGSTSRGPVSRMRTCQLLFNGPTPLASESLALAMAARSGREVAAEHALELAAAFNQIAQRTRPPWRHDLRVAARALPPAVDTHATDADYREYKQAHNRIVADCSPFID